MTLTRWEWLGPGNIGGRTRGIVVDPGHPNKMWAASAGGGVWITRNGGAKWAPVDDFLGNLACACLAMDPSDPATIYVGTGEGFSNVDALRGNGVFRTTDATTWAPLPATQTADFRGVTRIAVSASGAVVLAATDTGLFRSADPARATWTRVLGVPLGQVVFAPGDEKRAVAGALNAGEAWVSADGGVTWQAATHGPWSGRVELAYAVKDPTVVYASVQAQTGRIWRSTDGGRTYQIRKTKDPTGQVADYLGDQGWYSNAIWAGDPTDADLIVTGGVDLWRSTDGGDHLAEISTWWDPASAHADHHAIVSHPPTTGCTTGRCSSATTAGCSRRWTSRWWGRSRRRRSSTAGPSWTTTTASRSSSPVPATPSAERSSAVRRTTAPSCSTPRPAPRDGRSSRAATAAGAPATRPTPPSSTASTSS
ncbi:hypothetical protein O1L60_33290 [Streptomyces diastatochromogenes]|nr:hypothetical protein [Streptomyces diastatochromogenes]